MAFSLNSMASLYVGDLDSEVNEQILYQKFSSVGQLMSIRICKDVVTHRSLGYAYVNYRNPADAERALDTMNFDIIKGKPIRIMFVQRDPSLRKSGIGNIFIKNLDTGIDAKALFDTFSAFGNILSCKISLDANGISKGYGFIHFEDKKAADNAIDKVNGMLLNGKKVYVGIFIPRSRRDSGSDQNGLNNLYVKNFGEDLSEEEFLDIFQHYGTITSHKIISDEQGKSKGFGFVAFECSESATKALEELDGELFNRRRLYVARAQKKSERQEQLKRHFDLLRIERRTRGTNLYVKYLDDSIDDDCFCQIFSAFGTVISGKIMREHGRNRGFGFISFSLPDEATKAIAEMNGKMVNGKPLYVAFAQGKTERAAALRYRSIVSNMQPRVQAVPCQVRLEYHNQVVPTTSYQRSYHYSSFRQRIGCVRKERLFSRLLGLSSEDRRQLLGENLYPKVQRINMRFVGKITGMLLEMDTVEVLELLENDSLLKEKVREADLVLRTSGY